MAKTYAADFVYEYEEMNMCIYGVTIYRNGILKDVQLELRDFGLFEYDEETDCYYFEEGVYSNEAEILALLLQRKVDRKLKSDP